MCREVSVGLVIGAVLSKKDLSGKIRYTDLNDVMESVRKYAPEYYVDFSRNSVYSEIAANCDYFTLKDGEIQLTPLYMENIDRVKTYFYDVIDENLRKAIDNLELGLKPPFRPKQVQPKTKSHYKYGDFTYGMTVKNPNRS